MQIKSFYRYSISTTRRLGFQLLEGTPHSLTANAVEAECTLLECCRSWGSLAVKYSIQFSTGFTDYLPCCGLAVLPDSVNIVNAFAPELYGSALSTIFHSVFPCL